MLLVIPVIDLRQGQVVHARRGERDRYRPVQSMLCDGADPEAVIDGLLSLFAFRNLYVADLDAIQGQGDHRAHLARLRTRFPGLEFWVDAALHTPAALRQWRAQGLGVPIVGAESLPSASGLEQIAAAFGPEEWILSLDFRGDEFLGPAQVLANTQFWPQRIIAMNLAKVGSEQGPDVALLSRLAALGGERHVLAAGGVRDAGDLLLAQQAGAHGALVATALHDGRLGAQALRQLCCG